MTQLEQKLYFMLKKEFELRRQKVAGATPAVIARLWEEFCKQNNIPKP